MEIKEIEAAVEAVLFASGDAVPLDRLAKAFEIDKRTMRLIIDGMMDNWALSGRGIMIRQINDSYQLCTRPEYEKYIKRLFEPRQKQGLSQAAFETLAIIAYNEPVTKAKIEHIRGVNSDSALARLIERNLVREAGRMDAPGKPILYETTEEFLRAFGLKSLSYLPPLSQPEIQTMGEEDSDEDNVKELLQDD